MRKIELLAPARTADIGIDAISHGADAVYIGPESYGARRVAANSIDDIKRLTEFAHIFRARVYATVNTIIYPQELHDVEHLCHKLYRAGVDALIVQDMALLRLDLPPIELHASTQCDIRTPEKALFLQEAGFSQLVLARELTPEQIKEIAATVTTPLEFFVHGALCVSYSGRCHASQMCFGRSANRGECAQMCRLPYTLTDAQGKVICRDKHLLSLHDLNLSDRMETLLSTGISSLKIEGRLKDSSYVKNVVSAYRAQLDALIAKHPDSYRRSSYGTSEPGFTPALQKSFNRGFTHYFFDCCRPSGLTSPLTPKSLGEPVSIAELNPGDGIAYINHKGEYTGLRVNRVDGKRIITFGGKTEPGVRLRRTFDRRHTEAVEKSHPQRRMMVSITLQPACANIADERGLRLSLPMPSSIDGTLNRAKLKEIFGKLGNTPYTLNEFYDCLPDNRAYTPSSLTALRRALTAGLDTLNVITYPFGRRRSESRMFPYPAKHLDYADNVANPLAADFYREHGVEDIEPALEQGTTTKGERVVMTCRHCILRELGRCLRTPYGKGLTLPLHISSGNNKFTLRFNCKDCEMQLLYNPDKP